MRPFSLLVAAGLLLAPVTAIAATPGALQAEQSPTMPAPAGKFLGKGGGGKLGGLLSPEQRVMFMRDARAKLKDMTADQKKGFRKDQIRKFLTMSEPDRQKFKAGLQAEWDALPGKQKAKMQQRLARLGEGPRAQ